MHINLSIPSTVGVVAAVLAFVSASCDGAKIVKWFDLQTNVLFPVSSSVRSVCTQACFSGSKKLQPNFLPSGGGETPLNVTSSGSARFVTDCGSFVTGSFRSMLVTCKVETTIKGSRDKLFP